MRGFNRRSEAELAKLGEDEIVACIRAARRHARCDPARRASPTAMPRDPWRATPALGAA